MGKNRFLILLLVCTLIVTTMAGCSRGTQTENDPSSGWDTGQVQEPTVTPSVGEQPTEEPSELPSEQPSEQSTEEPAEEPAEEPVEEPAGEQFEQDDAPYAKVDMTLGRPMSSLYTYKLVPNKDKAREIKPSTKYAGFFTAHLDNGKTILLGPDMEEVVYPQSEEYKILEPFTYEGKIYFRVEDLKTDWQPIPEEFCNLWWKPLGGYAVVDEKGEYVIPFGKYQYIDQFVEGKSRVFSVEDDNYYIIDVKGEVLKTYPRAEKESPYKLFPDGYIYTRSDKDGKHSHALVTWDGEFIIPYYTYKDDIFPKYLGGGTFLVNNDILADGKPSGLVLYSIGKEPRTLPKDSYDVFSIENNKYVTGMITNGLAGPLAKWDYVVTDYSGKVLIERGKYDFSLGGWGEGYAVAKRNNKWVLLDNSCREVKLPEHMELIGRYAKDAALFVVKVTKDFEMWRYANVPARYDNPIGIVDKDFNWVIPPGVIDYVRNIPIESVKNFSEYKQGDSEKNSLLHIYPKATKKAE